MDKIELVPFYQFSKLSKNTLLPKIYFLGELIGVGKSFNVLCLKPKDMEDEMLAINTINEITENFEFKLSPTSDLLSKSFLNKNNFKHYSSFRTNYSEGRIETMKPGLYKNATSYDFEFFYSNIMLNNTMPIPPYTFSEANPVAYICDVDERGIDIPLVPEMIGSTQKFYKRKKKNVLLFAEEIDLVNITKIHKTISAKKQEKIFDFIEPVLNKAKFLKERKNQEYVYYKNIINFIHWSLRNSYSFTIDKKDYFHDTNQLIDSKIVALGRLKLFNAIKQIDKPVLKTTIDSFIIEGSIEPPSGMILESSFKSLYLYKNGDLTCIK